MAIKGMILEHLVLSQLLEGGEMLVRKNRLRQGMLLLSGLFIVTSAGFLTAAFFLWLTTVYPVYLAAAYTGTTLLLLGVSIILGVRAYMAVHKKKAAAYGKQVGGTILDLVESLGEELEQPIKDHPKTAALLAGIAGYIANDRFL